MNLLRKIGVNERRVYPTIDCAGNGRGVGIVISVTFGILYSWARMHPTSASAHLLEVLHLAPRRPIAR